MLHVTHCTTPHNWPLQLTLAQGQLKDSNKKVKDLKSKLEKKDDEKTALKSELEAKIKQVARIHQEICS